VEEPNKQAPFPSGGTARNDELMADILLNLVAEPIVILDSNLRVKLANCAFYATFGVQPGATTGSMISDIPGDLWKLPEVQQLLLTRVSTDEKTRSLDVEHTVPTLGLRISRLSAKPLTWGESHQRLSALTMVDVTDQTRLADDLHACEERYHTLVDTAQDGIWTIDANGDTTFANRSMAAMLGTTAEEMLGKPSFRYVFDEDVERAAELFQSKVAGSREPFEFRLRRADGSLFWASVTGNAYHNARGEAVGLISTFRDISDQKLAEEAVARHASELARSTADLQHFAYVTSHDLREPLRTMRVYAQLLMRRYTGKLDPEADRFLKFVESGADRMDKLVHDLLTYSQATERDGSITAEVHLRNALDWAKKNLATPIADSAAKIVEAELPVVRGDELQLVQLFQHLLSNAIKYRRPGEPPRINVAAEHKDGAWVVAVSDNGIGIPQQKWDHVFGMFKRLHGPEIPGTGIGLAICRRISQNHGGKIWVQSDPDRGSTFFFTIPEGAR
jgi:PAS domain S-box-containing protein